MTFIVYYMIHLLKWVVGASNLISTALNDIVCTIYFKIVLILLLLEAGDKEIQDLILLITPFPFCIVIFEVHVIN